MAIKPTTLLTIQSSSKQRRLETDWGLTLTLLKQTLTAVVAWSWLIRMIQTTDQGNKDLTQVATTEVAFNSTRVQINKHQRHNSQQFTAI